MPDPALPWTGFPSPSRSMTSERTFITAAAIADPVMGVIAPGAMLIEGNSILASGSPSDVGSPPDGARRIDLSGKVVLPALVNAHAHLDLTHLGPRPAAASFVEWIDAIRIGRLTDDEAIADSVREGVRRSMAGGTAIVGDIAGEQSLVALRALRESPLLGVSFVEFFGLGQRQSATIERMRALLDQAQRFEGGVRLGLQPHAPYTCGPDVYAAAAELGAPVCTHLAETLDEAAFTRDGAGPFAKFLASLGLWDLATPGQGMHPIDCLLPVLRKRPWLLAHVNYPEDRHFDALAEAGASVAYCPRASAYFGHPLDGHPPHAYRAMLEAGVNVALGTDSIVSLDTPGRITVLDDMRFLLERDGADPMTLLRMATVNGARALEFDEGLATLQPGPVAGVIAIEIDPDDRTSPLEQAIRSTSSVEWLAGPFGGRAGAPTASASPADAS